MRTAAVAARVIGESVADLDYRDVFDAATVGGAKALRRDDIGRLAVGARADIVAIDLKHPSMMPVREPLRSLLVVAAERAVRHVYVDGTPVVADGRLTTIDLDAECERLERAQARMLANVPKLDWARRGADELAPMVLATRETVN
jgi:cytosine/adenosine deaminase-related metal-dependent hydrolase